MLRESVGIGGGVHATPDGDRGVIVDLVQEIAEAVSKLIKPKKVEEGGSIVAGGEDGSRPKFSEEELAFILKLIPQLIQL
ncbi:hypothetical protein MLD38_013116 [Melastoma candidum]|uniref:Uncharacterized protein n=1 Tax=Melastoma candidum TaxID=119954 RepID=A0ACB9R8K6_9MYRT|nr:hypothetical protein MLD38_013116 [Melastoma candidum]